MHPTFQPAFFKTFFIFMKNYALLLLTWLLATSVLSAQNFFTPIDQARIQLAESVQRRQMTPTDMHTFTLDVAALSAVVADAPMEFTPDARSGRSVLGIPMPDGSVEDFAVFRVMACEQAVYDRHPEIRTFAGYSLKRAGVTLRGSVTLRGLKVMVMRPDMGVSYVEPFDALGQTAYYRAYDRRSIPTDIVPASLTRGVSADMVRLSRPERLAEASVEERGTTVAPLMDLKVYRYAVGATHAFCQDNGGTKELALAAVIEYSNQVSAIYERDVAMRLQFVAASENAIFPDPNMDPYPNTDAGSIMGMNGVVLNSMVGINNYDIGHAYGRYQGGAALGIAGGITCTSNSKASGCSLGYPQVDYGDNFVNTIGQETGHQCSAGHTWNFCGDNNGRNGSSAFEPGSGSTIMSYGGACGSDNVQGYSDLYYHAGSIDEIQFFYTYLLGNECGTTIATTNHRPEVDVPYSNGFFIPISTPFELNASATDEDGDVISYTWEQMDIGPATPLQTPVGNSPLFRVFPAGAATNRVFPRMSRVLANQFDVTEQLPTYDRDMTFRFSARDNRPGEGGVGWKDVEFRATAQAGPFLVQWPNAASDAWDVGAYVNVTWDVANTFGAPVNCKKVNIRLSTDGGQTWPHVLASGVNNDGVQSVQVPNLPTTQARIRIDAADNVFFDVSNANFRIVAATEPGLTVGMSEDGATICLPNSFSAQILTTGVLGFANPVSVDLIDANLPAGAVATLGQNTLAPGQSTSLNIDLSNVTAAGDYSITVRAVADGAAPTLIPVSLTVLTNDFSSFALQTPNDGSTGLGQAQILRWATATDALSYDVQIATNPSFAPTTLVATKTATSVDSFLIPFLLQKETAYYWRVRPNNLCSPHPWSTPYFFATLSEECSVSGANDLPKNIGAGAINTIESSIQVNSTATISDLNVKMKGFHDDFGNMDVKIISPSGTEVVLFEDRCPGTSQAFNLTLDSDSPNAFSCVGLNQGNTVRPTAPLTTFNGQSTNGLWTLRIRDDEAGAGGTLEEFEITFCSAAALNPPFLVNNLTLPVDNGGNALITPEYLLCDDANNTHAQLTYTLVTVPQAGRIQRNGTELVAGDQFTQEDIDLAAIRYYDYGFGTGADCFRFTVTDGEGGFLGTPSFCAQPQQVGTDDLRNPPTAFRLVPNPATDAVSLLLEQPAVTAATVALYNTAGQLVSTHTLPAGQTRLSIGTTALARGVYVAQVRTERGMAVRKLVLH
jgi:subtilisin-like proprotein convertase family protein